MDTIDPFWEKQIDIESSSCSRPGEQKKNQTKTLNNEKFEALQMLTFE